MTATFIVATTCFLLVSSASDTQFSSEILAAINAQNICHVHLINKEKLRTDGIIRSPITIDTDSLNTWTSFFLRPVKGFNCIWLIFTKFHYHEKESEDNMKHILTSFHHLYISPLRDADTKFMSFVSASAIQHNTIFVLFTGVPLPILFSFFSKFVYLITLLKHVVISQVSQLYEKHRVYLLCRFCGEVAFIPIESFLFQTSNIYLEELLPVTQYKMMYLPDTLWDFLISHEKSMEMKRLKYFTAPAYLPSGLIDGSRCARIMSEIVLLEIGVQSLNSSISYSQGGKSPLDKMDLIIGQDFIDDSQIDSYLRSKLIPLSSVTQTFLTCYHVPLITYWFYVAPFQAGLWTTFLIFAILVYLSLKVVIKLDKTQRCYRRYSVFLYILSTVTDDSCGMPEQLSKNTATRSILAPWLLASVVFVNAYVGIVISSLSTPFELTSITRFENLTTLKYSYENISNNFYWLQVTNSFNTNDIKNLNENLDTILKVNIPERNLSEHEDFIILSSFQMSFKNYDYTFSSGTGIYYWSNFQSFHWFLLSHAVNLVFPITVILFSKLPNISDYASFLSTWNSQFSQQSEKLNELLFNIFYPSHLVLPLEIRNTIESTDTDLAFSFNKSLKVSYLIEKEITKCGRTVYADTEEDVEMEFQYLSRYYPHIKFFKAQQNLLQVERYLLFPDATVDSKIVFKTKLLIASGIYDKVKEYFLHSTRRSRVNLTLSNPEFGPKTKNGPRSMSLRDRIKTFFVFFLSCLAVSLIGFLGDILMLRGSSTVYNFVLIWGIKFRIENWVFCLFNTISFKYFWISILKWLSSFLELVCVKRVLGLRRLISFECIRKVCLK